MNFSIRPATEEDVPLILSFIRQLAEYERISHGVDVTESMLRENLFGRRRYAEVLIGEANAEPVAFAVFFHNFSTFRGKPGLYLEDLFVIPQMRGKGFGRAMLVELGRIATERECARIEWAVLDWNQPAIEFYKTLGAIPMDEWTIFRITDQALERLATRKDL
jgi:GNAT superfamily N-acetyltransferase